jgi:hypothetical protein
MTEENAAAAEVAPVTGATHPFQLQAQRPRHTGLPSEWFSVGRYRTLQGAKDALLARLPTSRPLRIHVTPEDASQAILEAQRWESRCKDQERMSQELLAVSKEQQETIWRLTQELSEARKPWGSE